MVSGGACGRSFGFRTLAGVRWRAGRRSHRRPGDAGIYPGAPERFKFLAKFQKLLRRAAEKSSRQAAVGIVLKL